VWTTQAAGNLGAADDPTWESSARPAEKAAGRRAPKGQLSPEPLRRRDHEGEATPKGIAA